MIPFPLYALFSIIGAQIHVEACLLRGKVHEMPISLLIGRVSSLEKTPLAPPFPKRLEPPSHHPAHPRAFFSLHPTLPSTTNPYTVHPRNNFNTNHSINRQNGQSRLVSVLPMRPVLGGPERGQSSKFPVRIKLLLVISRLSRCCLQVHLGQSSSHTPCF